MDPREAQSGGDPDEETMARKRARRVSFAETTAVHVFDRDEDFETSPGLRPGGGEDSEERPLVGFPLEHSDSDDSRGSVREEDDEEEEEQESFLRDMNSYSPGSAADSVTSNDDENFFGPVSTSFIKTGRYSDSGMSDDNNHDITLDSTAFSLHFRNIALPDDRTANSMGSVRTPTEVSMPADSGNFMVPTGRKKHIPHSKLSNGKIGGSASDSNNMSLIMENPNRYDYGKISPRLEALLAEVNRSIEPDSPSTDYRVVTSDHHRAEDTDATTTGKEQILTDGITEHCDNANNYSVSACQPDVVSLGSGVNQVGDRSYVSNMSAGQHSHSFQNQENQGAISSFSKNLAMQGVSLASTEVISSENHEIFSPKYTNSKVNAAQESDDVNHDSFGDKTDGAKNHSISSPLSPSMKTAEGQQHISEYESGMHTPKCVIQLFQSPVHGSVTSILAKRQQLFSDPVNSSTKEQPPSSIKMELERHSERILAIKSSISKFKVPEKLKLIPHLSFAMEDNAQSQLDGYSERTHDNPGRSQLGSPAVSGKENANGASVRIKDQEFSRELSGLETEILNDSRGLKLAQSTPSFRSPNLGINIKKQATSQKLIEGPSTSNTYGSFEKQTIVELRENGVSQDSLSKAIYSTEVPGPNLSSIQKADRAVKSSSVLKEKTFYSTHSSVNHDKLQNFAAAMDIVENGLCSHNSQLEVEISTNVRVGTHDKDCETRNFSPRIREKLSKEDSVASHDFASEDSYDMAATKKNSVKWLGPVTAENPLNKIDSYNSPPSKRMSTAEHHPNQNLVMHGSGNPDYHHQKFLASPEPFSSKDVDKIGRKRRINEVLLMDKGLTNEVSKTQKSPKILPEVVSSISGLPLRNAVDGDNGHNFGVQGQVKHWADILSKVSGSTKQSFSPSVYNLEAKQLDVLEDVLGELHMARKYEGLSKKILSLKNQDPLADLHQERVAEARRLQEMLAYEQAKLQLKHVKLDQLHKTSRQCQSVIQECYKLKSILTQFRTHGTRAFQTREATLSTVSLDSESNNQEEQHKCTSMQQELEMLDKKVNQLMKSFAALCKIKGNVDCNGVIKVVREHLDKREHCWAIHQNLQLWEVSKIEKKQEQCDICLNYRNLLSERFVLKTRPTSSISMYLSLNKTNIEKSFPFMNVCTAFEFVFKARNDRRLAGSKSLQQETLATSLLLGTLLDVLEEVQIALFQIPYLVSLTFLSQYCQLELQLCFLSNKSGRKLSLSFSMTDLNCAMYPYEPAQLDIKILERQTTLPISSFDKVMSAVRSLQSGRALVLRLCQRVSEVVQVSS
ncbi:hypothetical protein DsansV1_C14g0128381 [Dioscorea sansibarensis]